MMKMRRRRIALLRPKNNTIFLFLAAFAFVIGVFDSTILVNAQRLGGVGGGGNLKDILLAECDNLSSSSTNNYNYIFQTVDGTKQIAVSVVSSLPQRSSSGEDQLPPALCEYLTNDLQGFQLIECRGYMVAGFMNICGGDSILEMIESRNDVTGISANRMMGGLIDDDINTNDDDGFGNDDDDWDDDDYSYGPPRPINPPPTPPPSPGTTRNDYSNTTTDYTNTTNDEADANDDEDEEGEEDAPIPSPTPTNVPVVIPETLAPTTTTMVVVTEEEVVMQEEEEEKKEQPQGEEDELDVVVADPAVADPATLLEENASASSSSSSSTTLITTSTILRTTTTTLTTAAAVVVAVVLTTTMIAMM